MNLSFSLLIFLILELTFTTATITTTPASKSSSKKLRPRFKNVILNTNIALQMNTGDNIIIECPMSQSSQKFNKLNRETHSDMKSTPVFITSWYKNQIKISQFIDENMERFKFLEKKLRIKDLTKTDSGVYSCEIITGTGLSVTNSNLTLQVNEAPTEIEFKSRSEEISNRETLEDYKTSENNQENGETQDDLDEYIKGEKPVFEDNYQDIQTSFSQLESTQALLDCSSRGIPSPQIIWLKNGRIMSEEDYGLIRNTMKLNLKGLSVSDSGIYICQVSNQFGKLNRTFDLRVLERLKLINGDEANVTANYNESALLSCKIEPFSYTSSSDTTYKWYVSSNELNDQNSINLMNRSSSIYINGIKYYQLDLKMETNRPVLLNAKYSLYLSKSLNENLNEIVQLQDGSMIIKKFSSKNIGSYACMVNNSRGFNYRHVYLNVAPLTAQLNNKEILNSEIHYDILNHKQATNQLNFKSHDHADQLLTTPIIIIISISTVSVILIVFLVCFYKHL